VSSAPYDFHLPSNLLKMISCSSARCVGDGGVLSQDPSLSTLVGALTAADISLDDSVTSVTVFAPSNAAFSKLAEQSSALFQYLNSASGLADLTQVLSYHAAQTVFYPDEVPEAGVYTYSTLVTVPSSPQLDSQPAVPPTDVCLSSGPEHQHH
jgi:uncharacterized surface protein with fasciclin (FAS1) repeats